MTQKSIVYLTSIIMLAASWACTTEQAPTPPETVDVEDVSAADLDGPFSHEIPADSALVYIGKYQLYINGAASTLGKTNPGMYPNPAKKLVHGAKVDRIELMEILHNSKPGDSLYIMMGVMNTDSTELIFASKLKSTGEWRYFDFTQPCPTACPGLLADIVGKN